jgi:hypothetical protein
METDVLNGKSLIHKLSGRLQRYRSDASIDVTSAKRLQFEDKTLREACAPALGVSVWTLGDADHKRAMRCIVVCGAPTDVWDAEHARQLRDASRSAIWLIAQASGLVYGSHI